MYLLGLVAVAENRHGQSYGQDPYETGSLRPLATATASHTATATATATATVVKTVKMMTSTLSCVHSKLKSESIG